MSRLPSKTAAVAARQLCQATASGKADVTHPAAEFSNRNGPSSEAQLAYRGTEGSPRTRGHKTNYFMG